MIKYMGHLLRENKDEPTRRATLSGEYRINVGREKRAGRPRNNWIEETLKEVWNKYRKALPYGYRKHKQKKRKFNFRDKKVIRGLVLGAHMRVY